MRTNHAARDWCPPICDSLCPGLFSLHPCLPVFLLDFFAFLLPAAKKSSPRNGEAGMEVKRVGVVGAGTMGNGIAHVFARSGYQVLLCDIEQSFLDRALATITKNLDRELAKNKISADDKSAALKGINRVLDRGKLANCDFGI